MPPPEYPAQICATPGYRSGVPPLSAWAALDAYSANPHLRSSPTFEFLHFAVVCTHEADAGFDVSMLELEGLSDEEDSDEEDSDEEDSDEEPRGHHHPWTMCQPWMVFDVDLEDANGTIFRTPNSRTRTLVALTLTLTLIRRGLPHAHPAQ